LRIRLRARSARLTIAAITTLTALTAITSALAPTALGQGATPAAPVAIDGPSPDIVGLAGMSVARDGTGGLVYLKNAGGSPHVFVSRLLGGSFGPPQQIDPTLAGPSSQPVIAAGNGGVLIVAFVNGGVLYVVQAGSASQGLSAPGALAGTASNPSLQMTNFGKAYLAFTVADGAGNDVRAAYYNSASWALESAPLNVTPGDDAGSGAGRPQVGAAGDGVGIVVWGESGHIFSRRVWGTSPSVVVEQADGPLPGCSEQSASDPAVGVQGDSSYAAVAFAEQLSCSGRQQHRVLMNRLHGSAFDGVQQVDGLTTGAADGSEQPQVVTSEYGAGWVVSTRDDSNPLDANQLFATSLANNASARGLVRVDTLPNTAPPHAVTGTAGLFSNLIAWEQTPGTSGPPEIRVHFASTRAVLGPEMIVSSPLQGPADAADGLAAGGDVNGDGAVAWVQGTAPVRTIVVAQLYQSPGGFRALHTRAYARGVRPLLSWSPAREAWRLRYVVTLDGVQVAQATATAIRAPAVVDGPHSWRVTALNPAGLQSTTPAATVFVDTQPPTVQFRVLGTRRIDKRLQVLIRDADLAPPGEPSTDASGLAKVSVNWGDHKLIHLRTNRHRSFHTYVKPGRYRVTVTAVDRAGNTTRVVVTVKIKPKPRPHRKKHKPHKHRSKP
jgi:hypothetical protein